MFPPRRIAENEIICILHTRSPTLCVAVREEMGAKGTKLKETSIREQEQPASQPARQQDGQPDCDNASRRETGPEERRGKHTEKTQFYPRGLDLGIIALVHTQHMHVGAV